MKKKNIVSYLAGFMIIIFLILLYAAELQKVDIVKFKGLHDRTLAWSPNYPDGFSPYLQNVKLDKGTIRKREGYIKENATALAAFPVRNLWVYDDINENISYKFAVCGSSIFYTTGGGSYSVLFGTISATNNIKHIQYNSKDYIFNIDRLDATMLIVDGTTVTKSTNPPTGTVQDAELWLDRGWIAIGSVLYRSAPFDLDDWLNFENQRRKYDINTNDGQINRGLKVFRDRLWGMKDWSMYRVTVPGDMRYFESVAGIEFVNTEIGCMYPETIQIRNGLLTWFGNSNTAENGIYETDGESLRLATVDIPTKISEIDQIDTNTFSFEDTSESDFDAGTHTSVDIETTSGDIECIETDQSVALPASPGWDNIWEGRQVSQSFRPLYTTKCDLIKVHLQKVGDGVDISNIWIREATNSGTVVSTATITASEISTTASWVDLDFSPTVLLTAETTYFLYFPYGTSTSNYYKWSSNSNVYSRGNVYHEGVAYQSSLRDNTFKQYTIEKTTFTSQEHDLTTPISFGVVNIEESGTSKIATYEISVASFSGGQATWTAITDGNPINVTAERYTKWRVVYDKDASTQTASTQSVEFEWRDTRRGYDELVARVFGNNYWMAYEVKNSTINNRVLYYDKYNNLIPFVGLNLNSFTVWYNVLYAGSSHADGFVYELNKADVYSDNGSDIESYYRSKTFNIMPDNYFRNIRFYSAELEGTTNDFDVSLTRRFDIATSSINYIAMDSNAYIVTDRFQCYQNNTRWVDLMVEDTSSYGWQLTKMGFQYKLGRKRLER